MNVGKHWRGLLAGALVLPLLAVSGSVLAQIPETEPNPDEILMTTQADDVAETLEQRITRRKEALTTALTNTQTTRLRARCAAAQTKVTGLIVPHATVIAERSTKYDNILTRLTTLEEKLDDHIDTTELAAALTGLQEKIDAFKAAAETYAQTLDDVRKVGCTDDPAGFKASLEAARSERAAVATAAQSVRSQIQETIKPLLQTIRTQLQTQEAD